MPISNQFLCQNMSFEKKTLFLLYKESKTQLHKPPGVVVVVKWVDVLDVADDVVKTGDVVVVIPVGVVAVCVDTEVVVCVDTDGIDCVMVVNVGGANVVVVDGATVVSSVMVKIERSKPSTCFGVLSFFQNYIINKH